MCIEYLVIGGYIDKHSYIKTHDSRNLYFFIHICRCVCAQEHDICVYAFGESWACINICASWPFIYEYRIYMHVCTYICMRLTCLWTYVCKYPIWVYVCVYTSVKMFMQVCVLYMCMWVCAFVYRYVYDGVGSNTRQRKTHLNGIIWYLCIEKILNERIQTFVAP